jgi:GNAT superfamily N-acetyltransferase
MGAFDDILGRLGGSAGHRRPQATGDRSLRYRWVPIRSLAERHQPRLLSHLRELDDTDRYLRFGHAASDDQIARYVDGIDFRHDEVFGIFNRRLELIAMAHLAYQDPVSTHEAEPDAIRLAEFGVSVLSRYRGRGFGSRLFEHSLLHARNRGVEKLLVHALTENTAMLHIARNAGAIIERDGAETQAWLKLPPDDVSSHIDELLTDRAAELDYHLKRQRHRISGIVDAFREVSTHIQDSSGRHSE